MRFNVDLNPLFDTLRSLEADKQKRRHYDYQNRLGQWEAQRLADKNDAELQRQQRAEQRQVAKLEMQMNDKGHFLLETEPMDSANAYLKRTHKAYDLPGKPPQFSLRDPRLGGGYVFRDSAGNESIVDPPRRRRERSLTAAQVLGTAKGYPDAMAMQPQPQSQGPLPGMPPELAAREQNILAGPDALLRQGPMSRPSNAEVELAMRAYQQGVDPGLLAKGIGNHHLSYQERLALEEERTSRALGTARIRAGGTVGAAKARAAAKPTKPDDSAARSDAKKVDQLVRDKANDIRDAGKIEDVITRGTIMGRTLTGPERKSREKQLALVRKKIAEKEAEIARLQGREPTQ